MMSGGTVCLSGCTKMTVQVRHGKAEHDTDIVKKLMYPETTWSCAQEDTLHS